jgi:hypothetical protein
VFASFQVTADVAAVIAAIGAVFVTITQTIGLTRSRRLGDAVEHVNHAVNHQPANSRTLVARVADLEADVRSLRDLTEDLLDQHVRHEELTRSLYRAAMTGLVKIRPVED